MDVLAQAAPLQQYGRRGGSVPASGQATRTEALGMHERIQRPRKKARSFDPARVMLRAADIAAAATLIVVLLPVIVVVAILSYRPNLPLIQRRQCSDPRGQRYAVYEFNAGHEAGAGRHGAPVSDRPLRPLVRTFRGDQLPQLLNVIRGELSLFSGASRPRLFAD